MAHALVSVEIEAPVEALWKVIADFGEVGWMQGVDRVELTGEGVYHATCTAVDLGDGRSRLDWGCQFEPAGVDEAAAKQGIEGMYGVLVGWVKAAVEG